jgi:PAS domain S-box-containing protein
MEAPSRKKLTLSLRWAAIIVTSYLLLFGTGRIADLYLIYVFVIFYLLSNLILTFLSPSFFFKPRFLYVLIAVDTGMLSIGMYLSERVVADFYLVFILIIVFATLSRSFKLLIGIGAFTACVYGILLYSWGLLTSKTSVSYALRIPFIFIVTAFYGYIVKILTDDKQRQINISEDKYRGLFENANDGIVILHDPTFRIEDLNREAEKSTGYSRDELIGRNALDLLDASDGQGSAYLKQATEKGESRTDSMSLRKRDGGRLDVDLSIKRIDLGEESFYQVIFRDLTEQRILEKKIRESKRHLEAIFDGIQDQLSIQTVDYRILRVNRAVIRKYGTTFTDLIGKNCFEAYYQRTTPCERCPVSMTIETNEPASVMVKISEDGTTLRIFSYPIFDEAKNLVSIIEYVRDITEEKTLQDQLIQSEKLAGIGRLASGVAHEINNPLTGIIGMAEILSEDEYMAHADTYVRGYLTDIVHCGQRIAEIVSGLRTYSRIARKDDQTSLDINEVLEDSLKMVRMSVKADPVLDVVKEFQPVEKVEANLGEIQRVFTNLITNAFQAMNGKGGRLLLSTRSLGNFVEVKVADNGVGIPQENLNQIFDPFFTTKSPGGGAGLGLNVVYLIVSRYDGTVSVESKENVGTTFTVKLPTRRIEA